MKITIDPVANLRQRAEDLVNLHFNKQAITNSQRDLEHTLKRAEAKKVQEGGSSAILEQEALLTTNTSPQALAQAILEKPDEVLERGLQRRKVILAVRSAQTVTQLTDMLAALGLKLEISNV